MTHLGILGGGQLGRMLALAARPLGMAVTVVDPNPAAPARDVATHLCAKFDDERALTQLTAADVITFEFENIPDEAARLLSAARPVFPSPEALRVSQDRVTEKNFLRGAGIATAEFRTVDTLADAARAFEELGPLIFKTRRFGYDGKGQALVRQADEVEAGFASLKGAPAIAEQLIQFDRELSVIVCRGQDGTSVVYPLTENVHQAGILRRSVAPAPGLTDALTAQAESAAKKIVDHFGYVGTLALELFQVGDALLANEFAPRVHNSGHWTIEGAETSQFENHVRAVAGLPLGSPAAVGHSVMVNFIGAVPAHDKVLALADVHLHDYGKAARQGRKVGHATVRSKSPERALEIAKQLEALL